MKHLWKFVAIVQTIMLTFETGVLLSRGVFEVIGDRIEAMRRAKYYKRSYSTYYNSKED